MPTYSPIQIPHLLDLTFKESLIYQETSIPVLSEFVICLWEMRPLGDEVKELDNIIILDGCIDLVVDFSGASIGFSGMSATEFHFPISLPGDFMGFRLKAGAFHQLTGLPAQAALDDFLPLSTVYPDFDQQHFFSLPFDEAKAALIDFMIQQTQGLKAEAYTKLFDNFSSSPPDTVSELCQLLAVSPSQCQRNFKKVFGLSPKTVLSILRFQQALTLLTSSAKDQDALVWQNYYDQSHFINDFKRNIGLTPQELLARYQ